MRIDFSKIDWKWVIVSVVVFLVAQGLLNLVFFVFGLITLGIGFLLFIVLKPVAYFLGGFVTGYVSPGITMTEPAIGALIISIVGTIFDSGRFGIGKVLWMIFAGLIAFVVALFGAYYGEKVQSS